LVILSSQRLVAGGQSDAAAIGAPMGPARRARPLGTAFWSDRSTAPASLLSGFLCEKPVPERLVTGFMIPRQLAFVHFVARCGILASSGNPQISAIFLM
jgi:hypothetical protein